MIQPYQKPQIRAHEFKIKKSILAVFISIYLASLTDKDVLEKLGMINEE